MSHAPPAAAALLLAEVTAALDRARVRDTTLLVGVSGGADSVALLTLLAELRSERRLTLLAAHLDHALRPESAADAEWVATVCQRCDVPLHTERLSDAVAAALAGEDAARRVRREFLTRIARQSNAAWVALGHTADDQVETILHRLLRGTGPRGLAGMAGDAPLDDGVRIVRPLLALRRTQLEDWLRLQSLTWRIDATNVDERFTRNRLRHTLLPQLRAQFNPQVDAALLRLAQQCREWDQWLITQADEVLASALLDQQPDCVRLRSAPLAALPAVLRREVLVRLWRRQQWPEQRLTFEHWETLAAFADGGDPARRMQLPGGVDACLDSGVLRFTRCADTAATRCGAIEALPISPAT